MGKSFRDWILHIRSKINIASETALFDEPGEYDGVFTVRRVLLLLGCWMVLWIVWFSLCIGNVGIDVAENIAWGQNFDWGYDKNPYFGAWFSYAIFRLFHGTPG